MNIAIAIISNKYARMALALMVAFAIGGLQGWKLAARHYNAAALRAENVALKRDLAVARDQALRADKHAQDIAAAAADNMEHARDLDLNLNARPAGDRWPLSGDDADWLRRFR